MRLVVLTLAIVAGSAATWAQVSSSDPINIEVGSGQYVTSGGLGREDKLITIHYHKPQKFTRRSPLLLVMPGAGRNGQDYRDAWVAASEAHGVVILSPSYSEETYPRFWNYNLAGMIANIEFDRATNGILSFDVSKDSEDWIFNDFDRIFNEARQHLELETSNYDMFGHSAGGQVLHRMAMFHTENQANRILASNSGWYTLPTFANEFPYGLKGSVANEEWLTRALKADLVIFLGEMDDENETRGDLARSAEIDVQGLGRIERGKYFYEIALETAEQLDTDINWKLEVVPDVGHDYRRMSEAAAEYLYPLAMD